MPPLRINKFPSNTELLENKLIVALKKNEKEVKTEHIIIDIGIRGDSWIAGRSAEWLLFKRRIN